MFARCSQLIQKLVFLTSNSRKQTTPKLIRNPIFTKKGTLQVKPKSYNYDLSAPHVVNRQLYWNRTEQNRLLRNRYRLRRFKKLGIRPLFQTGSPPIERPLPELLRELRDRQLIMKSPGRTLANIFELSKRFESEVEQYHGLVDYALGQLGKQVALMSFREYSMYTLLLDRAGH